MNEANKSLSSLSIIAYYLSEYNDEALSALGCRSFLEAFRKISSAFGKNINFIKMRRDEFDALPGSGSSRVGWRNRPAKKEVADMAAHLRLLDFNEITLLVRNLIENAAKPFSEEQMPESGRLILPENVEDAVNARDSTAQIKVKTGETKVRVYDTSIIRHLKCLYRYRCQICGCHIGENYGSNLIHAHHIDYFSRSLNNDASNIMIVCPNHHGIVHDMSPVFSRDDLEYRYPNGFTERLALNIHL